MKHWDGSFHSDEIPVLRGVYPMAGSTFQANVTGCRCGNLRKNREISRPAPIPTQTKKNMKTMTHGTEDRNAETMDGELHELFLDELADILSAEQQLTNALPKMAAAARSEELTAAFESHLEETECHITRIEEIFTSLDEPVRSKECKAMKGLLEEGNELIEEMNGSPALDAALIAAAQKVEHYEIASYGTVCAWAEKMGHDEAVDLLSATLYEEKYADELLTTIAESTVNEGGL